MEKDHDRGLAPVRAGSRSPSSVRPPRLRGVLPYVDRFDNRWLLYEKEKDTTMRDVLATQKNGEICVAIGPEGGVEEEEVEWLKGQGFVPCTLGENISRTETAPLVVLSIIFYELNMR